MAVTIKDIAEVAGVSHTTVSRALRGNPRISSEMIQRIQQIASDLGYVANTAARGLKTNRSRVLGVIARRIDDPFFSEVLQGIEDVLQEAGYSLFLAASHRDPDREKAIMQAMGERRVDGIIISSTQIQPDHIRQIDQFDVPLVLINNQAFNQPDVHSVYHDDNFGSQEVTRHLLALGHRRIAYLGNENGGKTNTERLQGYQEVLAEAAVVADPSWQVMGINGQPDGGADGMARILQLAERPTAVVCYNDLMAIGAIQTAYQHQLQVPDDISVTGFDDIELAGYVTPSLTTFHQPKRELGREAAAIMLRVLHDEGETAVSRQSDFIMMRGELIQRQSTAAFAPATT